MIKLSKSRGIYFLLIFFIFILYILLAWKNPFETRSLISNLEPYPDTLYYSFPAWSFVHGAGFAMQAFDYQTKIIYPPLYSFYLIPFFALFQDIRSFYFSNILLGLVSLGIFLMLVHKIFRGKFAIPITGLLGFLFVTNYFIYTIPSLLMAENITMTLTLLGLYLLYEKPTLKKSILAAIVAMSLFTIKFSNLPFAIALIFLYFYKILRSDEKKKTGIIFISTLILGGVLISAYILTSGILVGHVNLRDSTGFSSSYFISNFLSYSSSLIGEQGRFLWFNTRFMSLLVSGPAIAGTIYVLISKEYRKRILPIILYGISVFLFMPFFYVTDVRYISSVIPVIIILAGFAILLIGKKFGRTIFLSAIISIITLYLIVPNFGYVSGEKEYLTLKKQISLNFKYSETPWNYIALENINNFIKKQNGEKPYVGTFLPPYYVKIFSDGNFRYLPLAYNQEFYFSNKKLMNSTQNTIFDYYEKLLKEGNTIYITDYYASNLPSSWKPIFELYKQKFNVKLVQRGCINTCNLYEVKIKD